MYFDKLLLKSTNKPRTTWYIVKTITNNGTTSSNVAEMNINNTLTSTPFTIANAFNAYFSFVAENLTSKNHFVTNSTNNNDPLTYLWQNFNQTFSSIRLNNTTTHEVVGTSHKSTSGPQQHLHWSNIGPFQGSADNSHEQLSGPFQGSAKLTRATERPFTGSQPNSYVPHSAALFRLPTKELLNAISGPFQGPDQAATHIYQLPFSGPRATESVYSNQSQVGLF